MVVFSLVLPIVTVAMPPEATTADTSALVAACDRAYHAGGCQAMGTEPPSEVVAEVHWSSQTEATVSIGVRRWKANRWIRRELHFEAEDVSTERYKSLGFALGSLAGTVIEVTELEAEARATPAAPLPKTSPEPVVKPAVGPSPNVPHVIRRYPSRLSLGGLVGSGLEQAQLGGVITVGAQFPRGWLIEVSGAYSVQAGQTADLRADFLQLQLAGGFAAQAGPLQLGLLCGPTLRRFTPRVSPSGDTATRSVFGAQVGARAEVPAWLLSPFVRFDTGYVDATDVNVDDQPAAAFGPWLWQASVGVRFDANLL